MRIFTDHPRSVDESYVQHGLKALRFGFKLTLNGLACIIHAILPFLFKTNASDCVMTLYGELSQRRQKSELYEQSHGHIPKDK